MKCLRNLRNVSKTWLGCTEEWICMKLVLHRTNHSVHWGMIPPPPHSKASPSLFCQGPTPLNIWKLSNPPPLLINSLLFIGFS